jgi:L-fucose mutarotase
VLKNIDPLLSGGLLQILDDMGHGDELIIADRNFPSFSRGVAVVRVAADAATTFEAVLSVFPLDTFVDRPLERMGPDDGDATPNEVQSAVLAIASRHHGSALEFGVIPRTAFYERADDAFAVVHTLETASYCDFILTKGTV